MEFVISYFGKMNLWPVEHFFQHICHHFWVGLLGAIANPPKSEDKYVQKCSTGQRLTFPKWLLRICTISIISSFHCNIRVSSLKLWNVWFSYGKQNKKGLSYKFSLFLWLCHLLLFFIHSEKFQILKDFRHIY